jgi:hypothetical protein
MKMNDGEPKSSPIKSPKASSEGSKKVDASDSKIASKYLKDSSSVGGSKQQLSPLDLQELKDALPSVPTGEAHNTTAMDGSIQD